MLHAICEWNWATIWAAVSAFFTAAAVIIGGLALRTWKNQERLKVKQKFKNAISEYAWALAEAPRIIEPDRGDDEAEQILIASNLFFNCRSAWLATEGLLEENKIIMRHWNIIQNEHLRYLLGDVPAKKLLTSCKAILAEKFVFK
jgi:hypothetical protein